MLLEKTYDVTHRVRVCKSNGFLKVGDPVKLTERPQNHRTASRMEKKVEVCATPRAASRLGDKTKSEEQLRDVLSPRGRDFLICAGPKKNRDRLGPWNAIVSLFLFPQLSIGFATEGKSGPDS